MSRRAFLLAFVVLQAAMVGVWLWSLLPLGAPGGAADSAFISPTVQVWSRSGDGADMAARFRPYGDLLTGTLLLLASLAGLFVGRNDFMGGKAMRAVLYIGAALLFAAGGLWLIASQWSGAVMFPPGAVNTSWLYMATRAFMVHAFIGYGLLLVYVALIVGDVARADRPLGFHFVALNWAIIVVVWLGAYVGLYIAPGLVAGG
jgi:heme/copper-type cytochrome/quinol oxidase subunit 3